MSTFYDDYYEAPLEPELPSYDFVLDDGPSCHQSLKLWNNKAAEVSKLYRYRLYITFTNPFVDLTSKNELTIQTSAYHLTC